MMHFEEFDVEHASKLQQIEHGFAHRLMVKGHLDFMEGEENKQ